MIEIKNKKAYFDYFVEKENLFKKGVGFLKAKFFGKKYNKRTLFRMRQFYNTFSDEKVSPLVSQLSWTHYRELLKFDNKNEINYYNVKNANVKLD